MLPTLVELDDTGVARCPAITGEDARAEAQADALLARFGPAIYRITGQRFDGRYLAPMHARVAALGHGGTTVAGAKDALFAQLTGELLTDPSTAAGTAVFDIERGEWDAELVAAAGIPALPRVAPAATALPLAAPWRDRWGLAAEFPVVLGAADSVLGALGVGARNHGEVALIAGTSAIVLGIAADPVRDPDQRYLVTPLTGDGWGLEMDLLAMGSAFDGIARLLGLSGPAALLDAAAVVPVEQAPLFLPYLTPGEQGALWDPTLTGTLHGLRLDTTAGHIGRALLTGVTLELRRCIDVLASTTGRSGPILLGGGSAVSPLMWQDLADATGREVRVDERIRDHSALGAALFGASSLGHPITRVIDKRVIAPRPERYDWWTGAAARHDELRLAQRVSDQP
jgi:sugar (pentulose or hexulose) kinase